MPSVMSVDPPAPLHKTETFQGVARNDFAYKMVQKMGWQEGEGLGRERSGITKHIWTKKRADQVGIGAESTNDWGAHSVQTNTFNQLLAKLDVIVNNSDSEGEKDEEESPNTTKHDKDEKRGKKAKARKAKNSKKDKDDGEDKKRKRKAKPESPSAESSDSDSGDEEMAKNAASTSTEDYVGRKAGRSFAAAAVMKQRYAYKRSFMRNSKDVKTYSSEDLSQILGFSVPPKAEDAKEIAKNGIKQHGKHEAAPSSSADSDSDVSEKTKARSAKREKKEKQEKKAKAKKVDSEDEAKPHVPSELTSGVLKGLFFFGGLLTGLKEKKEQDWEFNEETQERIATDAHAAKVEARKGLGFGNDRPSKLGKDYEGKKITFDDDDDAAEEEQGKTKRKSNETKEERRARKKQRKLEKEGSAEAEEEAEVKTKKKKLKKAVSNVEDCVHTSKALKRSSSFP